MWNDLLGKEKGRRREKRGSAFFLETWFHVMKTCWYILFLFFFFCDERMSLFLCNTGCAISPIIRTRTQHSELDHPALAHAYRCAVPSVCMCAKKLIDTDSKRSVEESSIYAVLMCVCLSPYVLFTNERMKNHHEVHDLPPCVYISCMMGPNRITRIECMRFPKRAHTYIYIHEREREREREQALLNLLRTYKPLLQSMSAS